MQPAVPNQSRSAVPSRARWRPVWTLVVAALASVGLLEVGLTWLPAEPSTRFTLAPVDVWTLQSIITGNLAIFLCAAWMESPGRAHRPRLDASDALLLGLISAWFCIGWTLWAMMRAIRSGLDDILLPVLIFTLVTLAPTIPLLWHAIHRMAHPRHSGWIVAGFLAFAVSLQSWTTAHAPDDPVYVYLVDSALIFGAVVVWLIVLSRPGAGPVPLQPA